MVSRNVPRVEINIPSLNHFPTQDVRSFNSDTILRSVNWCWELKSCNVPRIVRCSWVQNTLLIILQVQLCTVVTAVLNELCTALDCFKRPLVALYYLVVSFYQPATQASPRTFIKTERCASHDVLGAHEYHSRLSTVRSRSREEWRGSSAPQDAADLWRRNRFRLPLGAPSARSSCFSEFSLYSMTVLVMIAFYVCCTNKTLALCGQATLLTPDTSQRRGVRPRTGLRITDL